MAGGPVGLSLMSFEEASAAVVAYLKETVPLGFWSVSQYRDGRQVYLTVQDDVYGAVAGGWHAWSDSFCQSMVTGATPQIAPDAMAVPEYAAAGIAQVLPVAAYVGIPIRAGDGQLFGTLCGMDPTVQGPELLAHGPGLQLLATLLGQILLADSLRGQAADREEQLRWRAYHDTLTGLPNRALLLDRVAHALNLHRRDHRALAVLLIDLDNFKAVNDTLGHAAGDELLIRVAKRLQGSLRPGDTLARLGGDEFAVLLEDGGEPAAVASRVLSCLTEPFRIADTMIRAAASVGVTDLTATTATLSVDALIARADLAMYTAKRAGKGRLAVYDPLMTLPEGRALQLSEPLREAIATGAVRAVFQPICHLDTGAVTGYEALARWRHDGVDLPPDVFIPVAARSGLLGALTDHMLDLACAQLARWSNQLGHDRLRVAVNVPPDVLGDRGFPGRVAERLDRYHLGRAQLVLEITEDALLADPDAARAVAHQLRDLGVVLSLDDFGVGFSSLLHLQRIPLDAVKIDRAFTSDLDSNPRTERFMRALLSLGRDLELAVIVEGIERPAQADVLRRLHCTLVQGYLFGRPGPAPDLSPIATHAGTARTG